MSLTVYRCTVLHCAAPHLVCILPRMGIHSPSSCSLSPSSVTWWYSSFGSGLSIGTSEWDRYTRTRAWARARPSLFLSWVLECMHIHAFVRVCMAWRCGLCVCTESELGKTHIGALHVRAFLPKCVPACARVCGCVYMRAISYNINTTCCQAISIPHAVRPYQYHMLYVRPRMPLPTFRRLAL